VKEFWVSREEGARYHELQGFVGKRER